MAEKETKAQKVERLKREKNSWEHLDEIRQFAREGFSSIPPEWIGTYFRTWGIYTQGDGIGAVGGVGGEGKAVPYFMVRVRIPNGIMNTKQLRTVANLSEKYGRGVADVTVRQNFQLHWVPIEGLPDLIEELQRSGMSTTGACGDVVRNVTGCPVAGVDAEEICDASPLAFELNQHFLGNAEFYNLPRKFKIAITGCRTWCCYPEINDIALTATKRERNGEPEIGFSLRVGGGLSNQPHLAKKLDAFVRWGQVLRVARGIAEIFRSSDVLRQSRDSARLKYLFLKQEWTSESFLRELNSRIGFKLDPAEPEEVPDDVLRDHVGIHPQKQKGLSYVGACILRGRTNADQLRTVADIADRYAKGEVRATVMQNLILVNVPDRDAETVARELTAAGMPAQGSTFARGTVACTGTEFCKLAITETKGFARWLSEQLDERIPGFDQQLKLHITGCPNGCGQHWIADLGLEGKKVKINGKMEDAYYFCVGGAVGLHQSIARPVGYRCAATEVPVAIERLLTSFRETRLAHENLRQFFARHSNEELRALLAGTPQTAVDRDVAKAAAPMGVEG